MISRLLALLKTYNNPRYWVKNISWRFPNTISDLEAVFIVGAPRSGTTLLQRVLAVHTKLFSIQGETGLFSYQNIFDPKRKHFGLSHNEVNHILASSKDIVDFFQKSVRFLEKSNQEKCFVEKTPQHILHLPFIVKHFPKSTILHIVRDGRDCYCSSKTHPDIPQNTSVSVFAPYWKKCVSMPLRFEGYNKMLTIQYEKFVNNPAAELSRIMEFLQLSAEKTQLDPFHLSNDKRAGQREFEKLAKPINDSSVGRWRTELSVDEKAEFERFAAYELKAYGYPSSKTGP